MEIATDHDPRPRVATLEAVGWGWVDFIRSIDAITLFGGGFGDIIRPVEFDKMCPNWKKFSTQKYYLAASVHGMKRVMERLGNGWSGSHKSIHNLLWHCPRGTVIPCPCQSRRSLKALSGRHGEHHDPVQAFYPRGSRLISRIQEPGKLELNGAVVFGHSMSCKLRWKNKGQEDLEQEGPLLRLSHHQETPRSLICSSNSSNKANRRSLQSTSSHIHQNTSTVPTDLTSSETVSDTAQHLTELNMSRSTACEKDVTRARTLRREKRRFSNRHSRA